MKPHLLLKVNGNWAPNCPLCLGQELAPYFLPGCQELGARILANGGAAGLGQVQGASASQLTPCAGVVDACTKGAQNGFRLSKTQWGPNTARSRLCPPPAAASAPRLSTGRDWAVGGGGFRQRAGDRGRVRNLCLPLPFLGTQHQPGKRFYPQRLPLERESLIGKNRTHSPWEAAWSFTELYPAQCA